MAQSWNPETIAKQHPVMLYTQLGLAVRVQPF
jgi:hypothetical protein